MNGWAWALIALCACGLLAAIAGVIAALPRALRVKQHVDAISDSPFMSSVRGLQLEAERMQALNDRVQPLANRAQNAIQIAGQSAAAFSMPEATEALRKTGEDLRLLAEELR